MHWGVRDMINRGPEIGISEAMLTSAIKQNYEQQDRSFKIMYQCRDHVKFSSIEK